MSFYEELTALMQKYAPDNLSLNQENKSDTETKSGNTETKPGNMDPGTNNHEPGTQNQEPASNNQEPGTSNQEQKTQDQPTSDTLKDDIHWIREVLYRAPPEQPKDPVEEFLNRPDGPLARYSLHTRKET